jgi:murein DD-endopeptidase MepM/ murein hydrolase activator NlpD
LALLSLDDRTPSDRNARPTADLRWLSAAAGVGASAVAAMALTWGLLAPAGPTPLVQRIGDGELSIASGPVRRVSDTPSFRDELTSLYAGIEGPDDRRYAGIDTQVLTVSEGDTLSSLLQAAGATKDDALSAVKAIGAVYDPRQIKEGFRLTVTLGVPAPKVPIRTASLALPGRETATDASETAGRVRLMSMAFKPDVDTEIIARRDEAGRYGAEAVQKKLTAQLYRASGVIDTSLFLSAASAGVPDRVTSQLMYLYSYDVDFQRDVQAGDGFEVFFTRYFDEFGNPVKSGDILFAALTLQGERKPLYRYQREPGREPEYFDPLGKSIKKSLLRTPIETARVSSGFGMRRHPILGYSKMHKGIDFAAPTGTPVLASGDGVIEFAGRSGGYGNYIRIQHTAEYETAYAHLSAYARGIREGMRVSQGDVIGYVGSTGQSTGPHLHYEILIDGEQTNPAGVKLDTNQPLTGTTLASFVRSKTEIDTLMAKTPLNAPVETAEADAIATELRGSRN